MKAQKGDFVSKNEHLELEDKGMQQSANIQITILQFSFTETCSFRRPTLAHAFTKSSTKHPVHIKPLSILFINQGLYLDGEK